VVVRTRLLSDSIVLMIADTGIGIAPQSLARLGRAVRAGREPSSPKPITAPGLGWRSAPLADQSAWRVDAVALEARHRPPSSACSLPRAAAGDQRRRSPAAGLIATFEKARETPAALSVCVSLTRASSEEKSRRIAGPRHDAQQIFARGFRLEPLGDAEPQDFA